MTTDDRLKDALTTLVTQITDWSNHAAQFGTDMMPELIRQYLAIGYWRCWFSLCCTGLFVVLSTLFVLGVWRLTSKYEQNDNVDSIKTVSVILLVVSVIVFTMSLYHNVSALMTIKLAPYVYILQHVNELVGLK